MADLTTYPKFKDWLLVALIGIVFALLGMVAADNRRRIENLESRLDRVAEYGSRISRVEQAIEGFGSQLDRIERKLP